MNRNIYIIFSFLLIILLIILIFRRQSDDKNLVCSFKNLNQLVDCSKDINICNRCIGDGYKCINVDEKNPYKIKQTDENNNPCMFVQPGSWCLL
jgi:hypothetical protein